MNALLTTLGTQGAAAGSAGSTGSMTTTFITFGLIILIFYFLIIRPQKKRDKETKNMLSSMKKGDKIVSIGGIRGTIVTVKETTVVVKVDDNTRIEFSKNAIAQILDRKAEGNGAAKTEKAETVEAPAKKKGAKSAQKEPVEDAVVVEETPAASDDGDQPNETK
ncbi:MAG: preprotein translocase subunit YajC [Sphaerochaetaceae bacterium]|jgi:preprotein translocase subunit YajC|nr:preprotein translocase subunit YajC [Sphaerochaetaceae bacterium]MDD3941105.1 preprotein translocase subunit YajC [Sphaerochaetaceae bacterium]MDX9939492.1 preprotein translocase subunit YajC [Sphaerochaetaceae bacterium]